MSPPPFNVKPGPRPDLQIPGRPANPPAVRSSGNPHDDCLRPLGTILQALAPGLFQVSLPNGKKVTAHLSKELAARPPELPPGRTVLLEISPFDLDRARIAGLGSADA